RGTVYDLVERLLGPPPVLLTFDDGGASAYGCVADLLEGAGWRGHFFITTDYLGTPGFVGGAQIRELAGRGHVIGTHSCSHPTRMARCSWDRLIGEWSRSAQALAEVLGEPVRVGSVPGGAFARRVAAAAAAAGLTALFTSEPTVRCRVVDGFAAHVVHRGVVPLVHLSPAGDTGAHPLAAGVRFDLLAQVHEDVGLLRARPHDVHVALQHVEQLRQLVESERAEQSADRRDALVVCLRPYLLPVL